MCADVVTIKVEGLEQVQRALQVAPQLVGPIVGQAVDRSLRLVRGVVQPYPPQPNRQRAKTFNTYVRGVGRMTRASFDEGGNYMGPREGPRGGQPRLTSEDLGQKWTLEVKPAPGGYLGILGNTASYADVVQGKRQPAFHAATGWVTIIDAVKQKAGQIQQVFNDAMMKIANVLRRAMT